MAIIHAQLGKYADALTMWDDVLQVQVKTLGLEHPDTAATQNNIGIVLFDQGKYPEALECHDKCLKTRVKVLGRNHPLVADTKNQCAAFFHGLCRSLIK